MQTSKALLFGPFRLASREGPLTRNGVEIKLQAKALALLWTLARQPGAVVTKAALFDAVWPRVVVVDSALAFQINALRQALGDDPKAPHHITTVHRVGFRFTAQPDTELTSPEPAEALLVGRDAELDMLWSSFARALSGQRQVVFVTGEAGIGKTALVNSFLARAQASRKTLAQAQGQCVEQSGVGESFQPVLEALGRLCRRTDGARIVEVLRRAAPAWLLQMPAFLNTAEVRELALRTAGATRERMLRELAEALDELAAEQPLVLILEDLHWSDASTIDLLSMIARRHDAALLLLICTYRPVELILANHPAKTVKQELVARGQALELALGNLDAAAVQRYLAGRFPQRADTGKLGDLIHRRTEGHPLFVAQVTEQLASHAADADDPADVVQKLIPKRLQDVIETQVARLDAPTRALLEAASVAGEQFDAASLVPVADSAIESVEVRCAQLTRSGQLIEDAGMAIWPDGTLGARFRFRHALFRDVLYRRMTPSARARMHRAIGDRQEQAYGERCAEIAAELAAHFEQAQDWQRTVRYLQLTADTSLQRSAYQEPVLLLERALDLLKHWPRSAARDLQEFEMQLSLGQARTATDGWVSGANEPCFRRAAELVHASGYDRAYLGRIGVLRLFFYVKGELATSRRIAREVLRVAGDDARLVMQGAGGLGTTDFAAGNFAAAIVWLEKALARYDPEHHSPRVSLVLQDPKVLLQFFLAQALAMRGRIAQALSKARETHQLAIELAHPFSTGWSLDVTLRLQLLLGDFPAACITGETLVGFADRHGFDVWKHEGGMKYGLALAATGRAAEGLAMCEAGINQYKKFAGPQDVPYFDGILAEAALFAGEHERGLTAVAEALAILKQTGERWYESALHRLKGELLLQQDARGAGARVESCFRKSIAIARSQGARLSELRTTIGWARLQQSDGRVKPARALLSALLESFAVEADSPHLVSARALLQSLDIAVVGSKPRSRRPRRS